MARFDERRLRSEICKIHQRLYDLGFGVANDGNTSVRLGKDRFLITPAGLNKARLTPLQISLVDTNGKWLAGRHAPSSELAMHLAIYKIRPGVRAIIHAHPPFSVALTLARISMDQYVLPEVVLTLKKIPMAPYASTGTVKLGRSIARYIKTHDSILLDRHGVVAVGSSLESAMFNLERTEHTAKITAIAHSLGKVTPLPKGEVNRLLKRIQYIS